MSKSIPYNLQKQAASESAIEEAVGYAIQVADGYIRLFGQFHGVEPAPHAATLRGRSVVDVGPGPTLGPAVLLACAGARVAVADRYLVSWDPDFHPAFFRRLLRRLQHSEATYLEPLRRVVTSDSFHPSVLTMLDQPAETLAASGLRYDVVFSNAALEHVDDIPAATRHMFAVTLPGGIGFHQIDLRDHRDFKDPLRYMTLDRKQFDTIRDGPQGNFGSRLRLRDYVHCFESAGFVVKSASPNLWAEPDYVASLRPHLAADLPPYSDEEIGIISALLCVQRPPTAVS